MGDRLFNRLDVVNARASAEKWIMLGMQIKLRLSDLPVQLRNLPLVVMFRVCHGRALRGNNDIEQAMNRRNLTARVFCGLAGNNQRDYYCDHADNRA